MRFAQLALQRQRTLGPGLAAGDGDVVKALAGRGKEEGVGVFQRQGLCRLRIGSDKSIAQLGQNHFERTAKAIQHADAVFQPLYADAVVFGVQRITGKRELGLGIVGMDQERCPPIDVALQQAHAFVGRVPALDHDVVQLVAQKRINYGFIFAVHFQEVRQRAYRSQAAAQRIGLEQLAHGVGGIAVLANE